MYCIRIKPKAAPRVLPAQPVIVSWLGIGIRPELDFTVVYSYIMKTIEDVVSITTANYEWERMVPL